MYRLLALASLLVYAGALNAQCSTGRCSPELAARALLAPVAAPSADGWYKSANWPGWLYRWESGRVVAYYNPDRNEYQPFDGKAFGVVSRPPWDKGDREPVINYGVDTNKLQAKYDDNRYHLNGREVARDDAYRAFGDQLVDDSQKYRLTVIGSEADRKRVMNDLAVAPLVSWRDKLSVQAYAPDHWAVAQAGFKTDGHPTIYLQRPDGAVLHRQDDYDGSIALATVLGRKANGDYDPKRDPDARKTPVLPNSLKDVPPVAWGGAGVVVLLLLWRFGYLDSLMKKPEPAPALIQEMAEPIKRPVRQRPMPEPQSMMEAMPAIASRPEIPTLAQLARTQAAQRQREDEAVKRLQAERDEDDRAIRALFGQPTAPPVPVPAPAVTPPAPPA